MEPVTDTQQSVVPPPPFVVPPPPAAGVASRQPAAAVGQLTAGWSTVFWVGWMLITVSFAAVWFSSRQVGLATWWLGPAADPRVILVNLFPFTAPLALAIGGFRAHRWLPWWGVGGAAFVAGIAAFDIPKVPGFAAVEFGLAAAGLLISVASFAGLFRAAEASPAAASR